MAPPERTWRFDLNPGPGEAPKSLARPLGFNPGALIDDDDATGPSALAQENLKKKRAMEIALGPGKSILMNGFMMYMSGAGIHIFSIMITFMGIMNPAKAILSVHSVFRTVDDGKISLLLPKLIFCAVNFGGVCVALWKMAKMGLLPVTAADWTSYLVPKHAIEQSGVPL
ncbi:conserved unknown protein [Ectocarpus siliculosus]|uniref:ER membrane protein complex subunit 4 n=1 Tax=Ectocarpus siliculosus TaxID=2880 RepID=D8LRK4_ECTSI|nr:conserved unknown protein [Ectocarpus siliculosus]|eukprot:CBN77765.1 conserved unknown protein [Ectocarpus siliculosus]